MRRLTHDTLLHQLPFHLIAASANVVFTDVPKNHEKNIQLSKVSMNFCFVVCIFLYYIFVVFVIECGRTS